METAQRLGIDLSPPGASECFSVLDDIISWVEQPIGPPGQPLPPGQAPKKKKKEGLGVGPGPWASVGTDAQEVAKVVARMLRQLETGERREQLQVQQVRRRAAWKTAAAAAQPHVRACMHACVSQLQRGTAPHILCIYLLGSA